MNISHAHLTLHLTTLEAQAFGMQAAPGFDFNSLFSMALASPLPEAASSPADLLTSLIQGHAAKPGALHAGRNMALFDPESAYRMMTLINDKDVLYKAQYSELSQMGAAVAHMQQAGAALGKLTLDSDNGCIHSALRDFVSQYNEWVQRFTPDMQSGGLLSGTQAAQVSRYELEQSVKNIFNGACAGLHGLADLGINVDPASGLLALDCARLDAVLTSSKRGAVSALQEFSANFAKSAQLLNADNNFIPNQLDNLGRAIRYITDNITALRQEFGTGDAAKPTGQVAQALAAYNQARSA